MFKEVVPMVSAMIADHMKELDLEGSGLRRLWLHQANANMNRLIAQRVLGHEASEDESPDRSRSLCQHQQRRLDNRLPTSIRPISSRAMSG